MLESEYMNYESPAIIEKLGKYLREPIPQNLKTHIRDIESLRYELAKTTVEWLETLYLARKNVLWPKDFQKGLTELDRTTNLNADTSVIEKDLRMLEKLEVLVADRLELMKVLLRQT